MCKYCENELSFISIDYFNPALLHWIGDTKAGDIIGLEEKRIVFIDTRGYLRLADPLDCGCLDHGEKIKIDFCPFCGRKIENNEL